MAKKYCDDCDVTHTALMCWHKPRLPIRPKPNLTWHETVMKWHLANPPVNDRWECYLKISPYCLKTLDKGTLCLEHVIPKSRGKKYKYDIKNIRPACAYCNGLKGSRTLEDLAMDYPQVGYLL